MTRWQVLTAWALVGAAIVAVWVLLALAALGVYRLVT